MSSSELYNSSLLILILDCFFIKTGTIFYSELPIISSFHLSVLTTAFSTSLTVFPDLIVDRSCRYFPEQFGGKYRGIQQTNIRLNYDLLLCKGAVAFVNILEYTFL